MKNITAVFCRLFKHILPSQQGMLLLKQGHQALKEKNINKAKDIYSRFSFDDKKSFKVQAFSAAISQYDRSIASQEENKKLYDEFIKKK